MKYDVFVEYLSYGMEFLIYYKNKEYNISQRTDLGELYFTISPNKYYVFYSDDELLNAPLFDGQTIKECWGELEF